MAYCELTGSPVGYDGQTVQPGIVITCYKVLSNAGSIMPTQIKTFTSMLDGTWKPPLRFERGSVAYLYMKAPGFDRDKDHGSPLQIPDEATAELKAISAAVSLPQQVPVAIPPSIVGDFIKLE
ncbi:MAG: hypothetical protein V7641_5008 [Blastocatellia bacterium]